MSPIPSYKPRQIEKILIKHKFILKRQSGSHRTYHNSELHAVVIIPFHTQEIPTGTLRNIIKQSKLPLQAFKK